VKHCLKSEQNLEITKYLQIQIIVGPQIRRRQVPLHRYCFDYHGWFQTAMCRLSNTVYPSLIIYLELSSACYSLSL
jgi:hypothetical protein